MPSLFRSSSLQQELRDACRDHDLPLLNRLLVKPDAGARDDYGNTVLHWLLTTRRPPHVLVQAIVRALPHAAKVANKDGMYCLHLAVAARATVDVVQTVYEAHPPALQLVDGVSGNLPLHEACTNKAALEVVVFLQQAWPTAVYKSNAAGNLPLHAACVATPATFDSDNRPHFAVLWSLLEAWPDAVMRRNAAGETPYDVLKESSPREVQSLQLLRNKRALCQMPERMREEAQEEMVYAINQKTMEIESIASTQQSFSELSETTNDDTDYSQYDELEELQREMQKLQAKQEYKRKKERKRRYKRKLIKKKLDQEAAVEI